jgi:hypothetical protein
MVPTDRLDRTLRLVEAGRMHPQRMDLALLARLDPNKGLALVTPSPERLRWLGGQPQQLPFPRESSILGTVDRAQCHRNHLVVGVIARRRYAAKSMAATW